MIGLGAGTIASFARPGDSVRFYEIDPNVVRIARTHFTYVDDAIRRGVPVSVFVGDARIVLERQAQSGRLQRFDVLAVDAFSSDAIPVHLLTREAFALYRAHLARGGVVAMHLSNRYLDLRPVVRGLAEQAGLEVRFVKNKADERRGINEAVWALVTDNRQFLDSPALAAAARDAGPRDMVSWTDDRSSLLPLLRR